MHYPANTMIICQHWQVNAVYDVCSAIFDQKGKNDGYFHQVMFR